MLIPPNDPSSRNSSRSFRKIRRPARPLRYGRHERTAHQRRRALAATPPVQNAGAGAELRLARHGAQHLGRR